MNKKGQGVYRKRPDIHWDSLESVAMKTLRTLNKDHIDEQGNIRLGHERDLVKIDLDLSGN